jgi:hypothetical protein
MGVSSNRMLPVGWRMDQPVVLYCVVLCCIFFCCGIISQEIKRMTELDANKKSHCSSLYSNISLVRPMKSNERNPSR